MVAKLVVTGALVAGASLELPTSPVVGVAVGSFEFTISLFAGTGFAGSRSGACAEQMQIVRRQVFAPRSARLEVEIVKRLAGHPRWRGEPPEIRVVTSSPDFDEDSSTSIGFALAEQLDGLAARCKMVAIGASKPMLVAARMVERRRFGPGVVPTSLQQTAGKVEDANAQLVATVLAERWNGIATHYNKELEPDSRMRSRGLYIAMLGMPPMESVKQLAAWHRNLEATAEVSGLAAVRTAWREADVAIVGVAPLTDDALYQSTLRVTTAKSLRDRGGVAMFARRCITIDGAELPLVPGTKIFSIDPAISTDRLGTLAKGGRGHVILVARGAAGAGCAVVLANRLATSMICDDVAAGEFVKVWDRLMEGTLGKSRSATRAAVKRA